MKPFCQVIKSGLLCLGIFAAVHSYAQTVTGYLSRKPSSAAEGCGCTGCNDAAFSAACSYPDPNGCCGTTEPAAGSGNCAAASKTRVIVIPAGCTADITAGMTTIRTNCTGTSCGAGMDSGDQFSITGSGGSVNCSSGTQTGASNANVTVGPLTQVGGQLSLFLHSDRVSEILTYTITYSGPACTPSPLPIELIYFSIDQQDNEELNLTWATASEHNTHHFDIEYSTDASAFQKAASVAASGESEIKKIYQTAIPDSFRSELLYFRLKEIDKDGSLQYSPIIFVEHKAAEDFIVMPNPTNNGSITISAGIEKDMSGSIEVLDCTGKKAGTETLQAPFTEIDMSKYGKGMYMLIIHTARETVSRKVIYH